MPRNTLLEFARSNPLPEQIEDFILLHPQLDRDDVDGLRVASNAVRALSRNPEMFRALEDQDSPSREPANIFRALERS
jgi:hypothetical protein